MYLNANHVTLLTAAPAVFISKVQPTNEELQNSFNLCCSPPSALRSHRHCSFPDGGWGGGCSGTIRKESGKHCLPVLTAVIPLIFSGHAEPLSGALKQPRTGQHQHPSCGSSVRCKISVKVPRTSAKP